MDLVGLQVSQDCWKNLRKKVHCESNKKGNTNQININ